MSATAKQLLLFTNDAKPKPLAPNIQGQSKATKPKQEALSGFLSAHASMVREMQIKHHWAGNYCYIETNAGSGWNDSVDVEGSPLIALRELGQRGGLQFSCHFIEKHKQSAEALQNRINLRADLARHSVICADHAIALPMLEIPNSPRPLGIVYADPNKPKETPTEALRAFFSRKETQMIDVLVNVNAHAIRRVVAGQRSGNPGNYEDLAGMMRRIGKQHWWIREPFLTPGCKWTFLFGSNYENIKIKGLGKVNLPLFPIASTDGKRILENLMGDAAQPGKAVARPRLIEPTPNTCGTRFSALFEILSSTEAKASASYALQTAQQRFITESIPDGEPLTTQMA